jgi:hypothetical protein
LCDNRWGRRSVSPVRFRQHGVAHSLHAIRSGRQRALAPCDQLNPHNRKAKINSRNNRDQFRDYPTPPITRDHALTCTVTSPAPRPHLFVPGPRATFAIAQRRPPINDIVQSRPVPVPAPSCPRRFAALPADANVRPCRRTPSRRRASDEHAPGTSPGPYIPICLPFLLCDTEHLNPNPNSSTWAKTTTSGAVAESPRSSLRGAAPSPLTLLCATAVDTRQARGIRTPLRRPLQTIVDLTTYRHCQA